MNVSGKIKHFLWKACTNSLPTKENLVKRKILEESVCQHCLQGNKDVVHALWGCDNLQSV